MQRNYTQALTTSGVQRRKTCESEKHSHPTVSCFWAPNGSSFSCPCRHTVFKRLCFHFLSALRLHRNPKEREQCLKGREKYRTECKPAKSPPKNTTPTSTPTHTFTAESMQRWKNTQRCATVAPCGRTAELQRRHTASVFCYVKSVCILRFIQGVMCGSSVCKGARKWRENTKFYGTKKYTSWAWSPQLR